MFGYTFKGSNSASFIFASHLIRGHLLKRTVCSSRSKFFPLRVDPILKGLHCPEKETGSHKSCIPFGKMIGVLMHLNMFVSTFRWNILFIGQCESSVKGSKDC